MADRTEWTLGHAARRVDLMRLGDRVDFEGDPVVDPTSDNPEFECEFAVVEGIERETPGCIVLHTSQGSFGFAPDHMLDVDGEQDENHTDGKDYE